MFVCLSVCLLVYLFVYLFICLFTCLLVYLYYLQDITFLDEMAHFDRERIPERVVHAKGAGAFGYFTVTHDISKYCKADVFSKIGKQMFVYLLGLLKRCVTVL